MVHPCLQGRAVPIHRRFSRENLGVEGLNRPNRRYTRNEVFNIGLKAITQGSCIIPVMNGLFR